MVALLTGSADRSYPFQYNISSANTWQKITETVQLDTSGTWATDNTTGLKILFDFGSGTTYQGTADTWASANYHTASSSVQLIGTGSATWYITGLQLEVGEQATPFEHRSYGDELQKCLRYYFDNVGSQERYIITKARELDRNRAVHIPHPVPMRATPSITKVTDASNFTTTIATVDEFGSRASGNAPSDGTIAGAGTFKFDAEL